MIFELILYYAGNQFKMAALNLMDLSLFFFFCPLCIVIYIFISVSCMGLISFVGVWLLSIFLMDNTTLSNAQPKITMLYMEDDCLLILNCSC